MKTLVVNTAKNFLIILKNSQQMHLKLPQKEKFKRHQKQLVIWLAIKVLIGLRKSQKSCKRTIINEFDQEISKERHASPEERKKIINDLRLI